MAKRTLCTCPSSARKFPPLTLTHPERLPIRYDWENLQIACFAVSSDGMYSAKYRRLDKGAEDGKPEESEWKDATRMLDANARIEWRQSNSRSK